LTPAALSYGLAPGKSLPWLFGIDATEVNTRHIFRALMGLYLGFVCFWIAGAIKTDFRAPALWSLVVFMIALALGRFASLIIDGWPHPLLVVYLLLEIVAAAIGLYLLQIDKSEKAQP
jgi:ABC-type microcin C transport system permease subunit YejE